MAKGDGPKQVTCSICKETVNKAQTLAINDKERACRKHQQALDASAKRLAEEKAAKDKEEQERKAKWNKKWKKPHEPPKEFHPKCFVCGAKGLRQDSWYLRYLIEMEKFEKVNKRPPNVFNTADSKAIALAFEGLRCLMVFPFNEEYKPKVGHRLQRGARDAANILGVFAICPVCQQRCGVEYNPPEIDFDTLINYSAAFEVFVRPSLQQIAEDELLDAAIKKILVANPPETPATPV